MVFQSKLLYNSFSALIFSVDTYSISISGGVSVCQYRSVTKIRGLTFHFRTFPLFFPPHFLYIHYFFILIVMFLSAIIFAIVSDIFENACSCNMPIGLKGLQSRVYTIQLKLEISQYINDY